MPIETSVGERLHMLLLLVVFIVAIAKLIRTWRIAPSSLLVAENAKQLKHLQTVATSLKQWIYFTFLAWGFLASCQLFRESSGLSMGRHHDSLAILIALQGLFVELELTFLVVIFVFLVRWRVLRRIEKFRD
ncbi:MAG: hypothetical protein WBL63_02120 [Candidatus Acidiferrum sp.]